MHIAVLGGRFDPPHLGHLWVARQVKDYVKGIDKVVFVPAGTHEWKPTDASSHDRLSMVQLMVEDDIDVSDIELKRTGISYTIDTIRELKQQTGAEISWIVGSDIVLEFDKWGKKDELHNEAQFLIFPRDPYRLPKNIPDGFTLVNHKDLLTTNLSSTEVKKRLRDGLRITHFVHPAVESYINNHKLYQSKDD